jgi:hypothetical protein
MNNITQQSLELNTIAGVEDLSNENAATIQGGWDLIAYDGLNGKGSVLGKFNFGKSVLSPGGNNKISSVRINAGRWKFSDGFYGTGESQRIRKTGLFNFGSLNNRISSLKRY